MKVLSIEILMGFVPEIGEIEMLEAFFANSNLTEFCIQWFEGSDGKKRWSGVDGLVYSFPANTWDDAVGLEDRLLLKWRRRYHE